MGSSPSKQLYYAARSNDIKGMMKAMEDRGDINYRNGTHQHTPLITAAKRGHTEVVKLLLAAGAADFRATTGDTALHYAAKFGHSAVVSVLLDRGADHHVRNRAGERPIDVAALFNRTATVRLFEARTCPFFSMVQVESVGFFRTTWTARWVVVHRARPWDNPTAPRDDISLHIFKSSDNAKWHHCMYRPELQPISRDEEGIVTFALSTAACSTDGRGMRPKTVKCKLSANIFLWLQNILSAEFGSGRGPGFDAGGNVAYPAEAQAFLMQHSPQNYTTRDLVAVLPERYRQSDAMAGPMRRATFASPAGGVGGPAPGPVAIRDDMAATAPPQATMSAASATASTGLPPSHAHAARGSMFPVGPSSAPPVATATTRAPVLPPLAPPPIAVGGDPSRMIFNAPAPPEFLCPLSGCLMVDPVILAGDGYTYARAAIEARLASGRRTSPITNAPVHDTRLLPNQPLRQRLTEWITVHQVVPQAHPQMPPAFPTPQLGRPVLTTPPTIPAAPQGSLYPQLSPATHATATHATAMLPPPAQTVAVTRPSPPLAAAPGPLPPAPPRATAVRPLPPTAQEDDDENPLPLQDAPATSLRTIRGLPSLDSAEPAVTPAESAVSSSPTFPRLEATQAIVSHPARTEAMPPSSLRSSASEDAEDEPRLTVNSLRVPEPVVVSAQQVVPSPLPPTSNNEILDPSVFPAVPTHDVARLPSYEEPTRTAVLA